MEQLAWSKKISMSIAELDKAHQVLIRKLIDIMTAPEHEFSARFLRIVNLLEEDFREEEDLMEMIAYPDLRIHREDHANLLATLHHVVPLVMTGDYSLPRQVLNVLPQWLLEHLVKRDAQFFKALHLAGANPVKHEPVALPYKITAGASTHADFPLHKQCHSRSP